MGEGAEVLVFPERGKLVLPYREDAANLIPGSSPLAVNGSKLLAVPLAVEAVKVLRNLGVDAPSPIRHDYGWGTPPPFGTQVDTASMLVLNRRAYVLNDLGTGKTRSALYAADYLMTKGLVRRALIVAPLSTLTSVWDAEIFSYFPHRTAVVLHGARRRRLDLLDTPADFYIINHDGVHTIKQALKDREQLDLVIIDEAAAYRNSQTRRWKALAGVVASKKYVWGMTGGPTPNGPQDAYGICKLITPERVPKYFRHFRDRVLTQVSTYKWVPKKGAQRVVHDAMQPSVRYTREETVEIPPRKRFYVPVAMGKEQEDAFRTIEKKFRMQFAEGEVTASNEGVKINKLLQIVSGFVYTTDGKVIDLGGQARLDALKDIIEATDRKVLVFAPFKPLVRTIHEAVAKYTTAEKVYGDVSKRERDLIFARFQKARHPRVIVAHPKCMAHGLTLTAADTIVWFSPHQSLEIYEQANGRITRASQKHKQFVYHLVANKFEGRVYKRLANQETTQGLLLDMFEQAIDSV